MQATFGEFVLDLDAHELRRGGVSVHLSLKAFQLLELLVKNESRAMRKDEIYRQLWGESFVAEANISNLVFEVRSALGDGGKRRRFIRTVHRVGYRFTAEVRWSGPRSNDESRDSQVWIEWGERVFPLREGEQIIGRDATAAIRIDSAGVSRRHALLIVSGTLVTIEDMGSKNGTLVGGRRIRERVSLDDGATIRLGTVSVILRRSRPSETTVTVAPLLEMS